MAPCSARTGSPAEGSSVHRLVDRRGGGSIGFAVGTHRLVAAFAKKLVRLLDYRLAIGSHLLDEAAGMLAMARALAEFLEGLAIAD